MRCSLPVYILAVLGAYGACWPRAAATQAGDRPDEWAPWWTSVEELERAVAADPGLVGRRYRRGSTVLHVAAERGDAAVVRWLLRNGAGACGPRGCPSPPRPRPAASAPARARRRRRRPRRPPGSRS